MGIRWLIMVWLGSWLWSSAAMSQVQATSSEEPFAGMVAVPGGMFTMGRDNGPADEQPPHEFFLPTFYIDQDCF
jgi:formylglycine-generating enzyme required for sulfatase activity